MYKSADTRLLYVTTGILLNELSGGDRIQRYTHIIIDEVNFV
jgi:HrpA-like RNA helicase